MANVILGGGIAGISAAWHLNQSGLEATVYEARSRAGGLLDNFSIDGFRFDQAVHLSFTKDPYVRSLFDQTPYLTHAPQSYCYEGGVWLKHPAQNNLFPLPAADRQSLILSFLERPEIEPNNYRDWLVHQYGLGLADRFFERYTQKYWTVDAAELGLDWLGNRVRRANVSEILRGALTNETPNDYYASEMRYPKKGGYRAFIEPMLTVVDIQLSKSVCGINSRTRKVSFEDGTSVNYESVVSSLPLPKLIDYLVDVPSNIRALAKTLFATQIDLVSVGFDRPDAAPHLWFYIYDDEILPARAYSPSFKSPDNVPHGKSSLQFEVYSSRHKPQRLSSDALCEHVVESIVRMNIARRSEILFVNHRKLDYGNVVFDVGMEARRNEILEYVESIGIFSAGRFGEWDYFWSDQSLMSGKRAAEKIHATRG